jgi:hypothetical protein
MFVGLCLVSDQFDQPTDRDTINDGMAAKTMTLPAESPMDAMPLLIQRLAVGVQSATKQTHTRFYPSDYRNRRQE